MTNYLNISEDTALRIADIALGMRVDRAAAVIAAGQVLFTVYGGNVLVTGFYGEIMVLIDGANQLTLTFDADSGMGDTVLGSAGADINTFIAGRMIYLPAAAGALTNTATAGACPLDVAEKWVLPPGHLDLTSTGTTTLGTIRWSIFYVPLEPGAYIA
jgi:hypothetical protein